MAKIQRLIATDPDILAFETIPVLEEVKAIVDLIGSSDPLSAWISLACSSSNTMNGGALIENACRALEDINEEFLTEEGRKNLKQTAIGVNCTDPKYIDDIILNLKDFTSKSRPIIVYPNRGDSWNDELHYFDDSTALTKEEFAQRALRWYKLGANIIGGCCRTDPSYIAETVQVLQEFR